MLAGINSSGFLETLPNFSIQEIEFSLHSVHVSGKEECQRHFYYARPSVACAEGGCSSFCASSPPPSPIHMLPTCGARRYQAGAIILGDVDGIYLLSLLLTCFFPLRIIHPLKLFDRNEASV